MKSQEIELWARDIVESVLSGKDVEDSRVELKSIWIDSKKAAKRLGGHANASRGENILWLIGIDEKKKSLISVDVTEKGDWYKSVEKCFDGFAPRLLMNVNFKVDGNTIVALYFDTATEAPFVVKNLEGGFPQYIVPWREGTDLRAAKRENLLKILLPIYSLKGLIYELEFNLSVARIVSGNQGYGLLGTLFRDQEFSIALHNGAIENLNNEVKELLFQSYIFTDRANQKIRGSTTLMSKDREIEAFRSVKETFNKIVEAHTALKEYIKNGK